MEVKEMKSFDVTTIPLSGKNLIEASAGTGKTYSIAVLVLRILLEKNLSVKELLLVTFTDAAVAELDERVRRFIREAHEILVNKTENKEKDTVSEILVNAMKQKTREELTKKLKNAILLLDELEVSTIHSFCNNTQKQFAFETDQLFDKQLVKDNSDLIKLAVNDYWRKEVTGIPTKYLKLIRENKFNAHVLQDCVKKSLDGYEFSGVTNKSLEEIYEEIDETESNLELKKQKAIDLVSLLEENFKTNGKGRQYYDKYLSTPEELVIKYAQSLVPDLKENSYLLQFPDEFQDAIKTYQDAEEFHTRSVLSLQSYFIQHCVYQALETIKSIKNKKSLQTFNDMISGLHDAISKDDNERIITSLKKKYKVVFIDEFQDTDKVQYDIFYEAFGNTAYDNLEGIYPTTVFYIGDPKQSIYGFRQANLQTYNQAKKISTVYTMMTNYRSVPEYLEAMNVFFTAPEKSFFLDESMHYIKVEASSGWFEKEGLKKDLDVSPVSYIGYKYGGQNDATITAVNEIVSLLEEGTIDGEPVQPSDIGLLVRGKSRAKEFKKTLSQARVPATVVDDSKVLQSYEADCVRYILEAFLNFDQSSVLKVLATPFTSYEIEELGRVDVALEMARFAQVKEVYENSGLYAGLMKFTEVYASFKAIKSNKYVFPERTITNYLQIADILNERQFRYGEDLSSIIDWLLKLKFREDLPEEYEQQLESDQDAVNIVTIHKSKGLSYKIVFVFFDDKAHEKDGIMEYQSEDGKFYYNYRGLDEEVDELQVHQQHQENRRLWYVALTRAVYKTYICYAELTKGKKPEEEVFSPIPHIKHRLGDHDYFDQIELTKDLNEWTKRRGKIEKLTNSVREVNSNYSFTSSWSVSSYSSIRKKDEHHVIEKTKLDNLVGYDEFVFHKMPRGASAGDFLHQIFERLDFTKPEKVKPFLESFQKTVVGSSYLKKDTIANYELFVNHVLGTMLIPSSGKNFYISDIEKRIPEMEFYFSIDDFNKETLKTQFEKPFSFEYSSYKGYIYGLIDLFFEHEGKYYILDWKSNHLGDTLEEYSPERVEEAMSLSNYHLQYLIYTISVCRFLKKTLPDFDYERDFGGVFYIFLRGCRKDEVSGVFSYKPEQKAINYYLQ